MMRDGLDAAAGIRLTVEGLVDEVPVHATGGHSQVVAGRQGVVAVVVVRRVLEDQAALYVVLINVHVWTHILGVGYFLKRRDTNL